MRCFPALLVSICLLCSCAAADKKTGAVAAGMQIPKDTSLYTKITWLDSTEKNFGDIAEGKKLEVAYRFLNSGLKPLIIGRVQPSCGCTVAEQPTEPILPGQQGVIRALFNSEGRTGINHKKISVYSNISGTESELQFSVLVVKKKW